MALQLIYTSAARLLNSPGSGYGVVARSEGIPQALEFELIKLSEYKEPADQGIAGPQFSYHVTECLGPAWHIFTCVRAAGADYSQRSCHIAHHLIIREDEALQLLKRSMLVGPAQATTPAGILLMLENKHFWAQRWQQEPEIIPPDATPPLTDCPTTENCPTWLIFSGDAGNARAFHLPSYRQGCLALVPQGTQSRDVLRLLHESSALSPSLGWGCPFCSYSVETDALRKGAYLFSTPGSALHQRARQADFPVLNIRPGMYLPEPEEPLYAAALVHSQQPEHHLPTADQPLAANSPLEALPIQQVYKYTETKDEDIFEKPWRKKRRASHPSQRYIGIATLLILGPLAIAVSLHKGIKNTPNEAPIVWRETEETPAPPTPAEIEPPPAAEAAPDEPLTPPLPAPMQAEPAPLPVEPPAPAELPAPEPPAPPAEEPADEPEQPQPQQVEAIEPLLEGGALPTALQHLQPGEELSLEHGVYILHIGGSNGTFLKRYEQALQPGKITLILRRTGEGEYSITPSAADPSAAELPPVVRLAVAHGALQRICVHDSDTAAVQLPLPQADGELCNLLLLPKLNLRLATRGMDPRVREMLLNEKDSIGVQRELISLTREKRPELQMKWAQVSKSSWGHLMKLPCELKIEDAEFSLPQLSLPAGAEVRQEERPDYTCALSPTPQGSYTCSVKRLFKPWRNMRDSLRKIMNEPCCGAALSDKAAAAAAPYTLANLCAILSDLRRAENKDRTRLIDQYAYLYKQPLFGSYLRAFFRDCPRELVLSEEEAASATAATATMRTAMQESKNRQKLMDALREGFSQILRKEYEDECHRFVESAPEALYLRLVEVRLAPKKRRLIWEFELATP